MLGYKLFLFAVVCVVGVWGHGMVIDPPNRSSLWRFNESVEPNYDDTEMYCGGFGDQWEKNDGKCGLCGDPWDQKRPRDNENKGKWGKGIILDDQKYTYKPGSVLPVKIQIEANHMGYFNFSVCCMEDPTQTEPEDCFKQVPIGDGKMSWQMNSNKLGVYTVPIVLPKQECKHAVLQWLWRVANSWGNCDDGTEGMGCGPQEQFMSCSDFRIKQ